MTPPVRVPPEQRGTISALAVGGFAVLCTVGLILGLRGLFAAPGSEPDAAGSASASRGKATGAVKPRAAAPAPTVAGATQPGDLTGFSSPTGNIRCTISADDARCDIRDRGWRPPPRPASCQLEWGNGARVTGAGAELACAGDPVGGGPALDYGRAITRGPFRCTSDQDGVTCEHTPSRHGFTLSRSRYDLH
jgi:hypothetical protein